MEVGDYILGGKTMEWDEGSAAIFLQLQDASAQALRVQEDGAQSAYSIEIENNSGTTVFGIIGTAVTVDMIDILTAVTTANIVDVQGTTLTTGKAIDISDLAAITTGKAIHIAATGVTQTDGILVHVVSASTALTSTGRLLLVDHTGNAGVSAVIAEVKSAAADETVVFQVVASAALAAGKIVNISGAAVTTGNALDISDLNALTTGTGIKLYSNSSDTSSRVLLDIKNDHASANGVAPLRIVNDAATTTNFFKAITIGTFSIWYGNETSPNASLSGTKGDILLNGSATGQAFWCTGTTNWTALA